MDRKKYRIGFIGAGNVASHLAPALNYAGHKIKQVISRSALSAQHLAEPYEAQFSSDIADLDPDLDIVFLTVPDHVLPEMINEISYFRGLVFHTSGSVSINVFSCLKYPYGILYPLQTFSRDRNVDFEKVPIFIEASDERTLSVLKRISEEISERVEVLDSAKRAQLHLAAVFANNFTNYLLTAANDILETTGIEKEVMDSLIKETLEKSLENGLANSQTGPAIRGDDPTIKKHLNLLSFSPELRLLYECLTKSIQSYYSDSENK